MGIKIITSFIIIIQIIIKPTEKGQLPLKSWHLDLSVPQDSIVAVLLQQTDKAPFLWSKRHRSRAKKKSWQLCLFPAVSPGLEL